MMTRKQYMDNLPPYQNRAESMAHHHAYFQQFVTPELIQAVVQHIGAEKIANSTDPHLNDIPLARWDTCHSWILGYVSRELLRETGEGWSLGTSGCIAKTAARDWLLRSSP